MDFNYLKKNVNNMEIQPKDNNPIAYWVSENLEIAKKKSDIEFWREVRRVAERNLGKLGE